MSNRTRMEVQRLGELSVMVARTSSVWQIDGVQAFGEDGRLWRRVLGTWMDEEGRFVSAAEVAHPRPNLDHGMTVNSFLRDGVVLRFNKQALWKSVIGMGKAESKKRTEAIVLAWLADLAAREAAHG